MPTTQAAIRRAHRSLPEHRHRFAADVLLGLLGEPKSLPCKYFYDERGSRLFDQICELDEYYPTRTELAITERYADEMAAVIGPEATLVEYGSGSSTKTRLLLDALQKPAAYVPVDISEEHLLAASRRIERAYPYLDVCPLPADFTRPFDLPDVEREARRVAIYFPGSTIGNFEPAEATTLLQAARENCGSEGALLIGIDLAKPPEVIHAAYNDSAGVTAAFNKNLLVRINRELEADIDIEDFDHEATYRPERGRVEIGLRCRRGHTADVAGERVQFRAGERIHTEYSHKYEIAEFSELLQAAGFTSPTVWTDPRKWFAVAYAAAGRG